MNDKAYFSQVEQNINHLLSEGKYREAHNLCLKYLAKYPEEKRFEKLKEKIEKRVTEQNEKVIKQKLEEIKPLYKEEKYKEILKNLEPLLRIAPQNEKLKKEIIKAQEKYKEKTKELQKKFEEEKNEKFTKLLNEDEERLIDELFLLERDNPGNIEVQKITNKFRDKLIQKKIKRKTDLIYSDKYDAIYNFIDQLKKIDDKNKRIIELVKLVKSREHGNQLTEKSEFIYDAENHLITLMKLKKYDKAIKVAEEILDLDPSNKKAKKILKKAKKKYYKQTRKFAIDTIYKKIDKLKE
ncbi:hypothetical protein GF366_01700, partial [Candidatus Peregrinibacteria bacterium]|nr:hypothetical protein [Candidatus Peregrinibacteria bacterium]